MNKNIMLIPRGHDSRLQSLICGSLLIISAILPLAGCKLYGEFDNPADPGGTYRAVNRITIPESAIYCTPGEDVQISANIIPLDASRPILTWSSAYPSVATVSQTGSVHAIAIGETTITARVVPARDSDPAPTSSTRIVVNNGTVESITMPETLVIPPGGSYSIQPVLFPPNSSSRPLSWRSSNEAVATVNSQGLVQASADGTATIICEGDGAQGSCLVEVRNAPAITFLDFVHDAGIMNYNEDTDTWPFMYMKPNTTYDMDVTWEPVDAATPTVRWSSENTNIATVDQEGIITAKGIGSTRIIASTTEGNKAVEIDVRVAQPIPVKWFSKVIIGDLWFWENIDLFCGSSLSFVPPVFPSNHEGVLSWTSSDTNLLSTDSIGTITAGDQAGSTTLRISATTTDHYRDYAVNVHAIPQDIRLEKYDTYYYSSNGPGLIMPPDSTLSLAVRSDTFYSDYLPLQANSSNQSVISIPEWVLSNNFSITSGSGTGRATIQVEQGDMVLSRDVIVTDTTTTVLGFWPPPANSSGSEIIIACGGSVQLEQTVAPLDAVTLWSIHGGDGAATISEEGLLVAGNSPTEFTLYLQSLNKYVSKTIKVVEGPLSTSLAIEAPGFTADEYIYLSAGQSIQLEGVVSPASSPLTWSKDIDSTGSTISENGLLTAGPYSGSFSIYLSSPNQSTSRYIYVTDGPVLDRTENLTIVAPGFNDMEDLYLAFGQELQLSAYSEGGTENSLLRWSIESDSTGESSITQNGVLTAGETASDVYIKVISRNENAYRWVHIVDGAVTGVVISPEHLFLMPGEEYQITAHVIPKYAINKGLNWKIADTNIATQSNNGIITAHNTGSTTIEIETQESFYTDNCTVTVCDDGFRSIHNHYPDLFGNSYCEIDSSSDGDHIVVASGNGVLVSHDRGNTWIRGEGTEDKSFSRVALGDDGTTIIAISNQYLYGSFDTGANWSRLDAAASRSWTDVAVSGDGSVIAACASNSYIFESRDDGASWTKLNQNTASWKQIHINSDGSHVQAIIDNSPTIHSFTYATGTWTAATISLEEPNGFIQELYPTDSPNTIRVHGYSPYYGNRLLVTDDGGSTWTNQLDLSSYDSFSVNDDGTVWLRGNYSYQTEWSVDGGTTVHKTERGMNYSRLYHISRDGSLLIIYAQSENRPFWIQDRNL